MTAPDLVSSSSRQIENDRSAWPNSFPPSSPSLAHYACIDLVAITRWRVGNGSVGGAGDRVIADKTTLPLERTVRLEPGRMSAVGLTV